MPKVSVIIPVYNVEEYLSICLDSVCNQTLQDIEILCIDDGSTDDSGRILDSFAEKDKRIKLFHQPNCGQSVSRNKGLDHATGKYIFFVDSDDRIAPNALEVFYNIAESKNVPLVFSKNFYKDSDHKSLKSLDRKSLKVKIYTSPLEFFCSKKIRSAVWGRLYLADILKNKRFIEGINYEDWPYMIMLLSEINSFALVNQPVYSYNNLNVSVVRSEFSIKKIQDYTTGILNTFHYYQSGDKHCYWSMVRKTRIALSVHMILSKIVKAGKKQKILSDFFYPVFVELLKNKVVKIADLSMKDRYRLFRLYGVILWKN